MPLAYYNLKFKKRTLVVDLDFAYEYQWTLECIAKDVEIQNLTPLDDSNQTLPPPIGSRANGESTYQIKYTLKSTFMSVEVMARHMLAKEKT